MESPPKTFQISQTNKRHKSNDYNPFSNEWTVTENPNINYLSPPRKRKTRNSYNSAPQPRRQRNLTSSPISTRYQRRIGTALYDHDDAYNSPIRTRTGQKRKHLSSPISPTFEPIFHSPHNKAIHSNKIDRYTPQNDGNRMNRYQLHSPTKRFVHNNRTNMNYYANIIRPSAAKKRKLGQNYSNTNDDPGSLNHRIKQKLSQHTYNMVLQSELLGISDEYTNVGNQIFNNNDNNHETIKNDNISAIQMDTNEEDDNEEEYIDNNNNNIYGSPSLPTRITTPNRNGNKKKDGKQSNNNCSHHPLCPCYNNETNNESSEESENNNEIECVCDSITSNVATNFLVSPQRTLRYDPENEENKNWNNDCFNTSMTPIKQSSQSQLKCCMKSMRNIAKSPFKVLDAPRLTDDFYLNLVDWSTSCNILSVGLGECVYLWSAYTSKVTKLADLSKIINDQDIQQDDEYEADGYDMVCSVGWSKNISMKEIASPTLDSNNNNHSNAADLLAVGSGNGNIFIFDTVKSSLYRSNLKKHSHRVGVISWKDNVILASGSRDRSIYLRDMRMSDNNSDVLCSLLFHKQEVCGLKWSPDSLYLASGGNDNKLAIWDMRYVQHNKPLCYGKHKAAVKAITWSPHESGLIASGGGTADRCIKFWNISNSKKIKKNSTTSCTQLKAMEIIDTGSQVCNLLWSKNVNEICSTHGYSLNQIVVWKYPSMDKIVTLTGHTYRVLYLAASPDGQTIVTGAGDETLRLWNIFPPLSNNNVNNIHSFVPQPYSIPLHIR